MSTGKWLALISCLIEPKKIAIASLRESSPHILTNSSLSSFVEMTRRTFCHPATGALTTTQPERNLIIDMGVH